MNISTSHPKSSRTSKGFRNQPKATSPGEPQDTVTLSYSPESRSKKILRNTVVGAVIGALPAVNVPGNALMAGAAGRSVAGKISDSKVLKGAGVFAAGLPGYAAGTYTNYLYANGRVLTGLALGAVTGALSGACYTAMEDRTFF